MVDISAPDEVTADSAFAITGRRDAGRLLAEWAARWTMVTSFDDDPPSYRFHSLLRGYLRAEAHQRDLPRQRRVHGVTAQWLVQNRAPAPALRLTLSSQDWTLVRQMLAEHSSQMIMVGHQAVVRDGLEALPAGEMDPSLAARLRATSAALSGDARELRLNLGRLTTERESDSRGVDSVWNQVLSLVADRLGGQRPADLRTRLAASDPTMIDDADLRLMAAAVRGSWWIELNDFESVETDLLGALRTAGAIKRDYVALDCRSRLCLVSAAVGDFEATIDRGVLIMLIACKALAHDLDAAGHSVTGRGRAVGHPGGHRRGSCGVRRHERAPRPRAEEPALAPADTRPDTPLPAPTTT